MHGFYVDNESNMISFDLVFEFTENDRGKIVSEIKNSIKDKYPDYEINIVLDNDFSD